MGEEAVTIDKFGGYEPVGGQTCIGRGREITPVLPGNVWEVQSANQPIMEFQCAHCGTVTPVPLKRKYPGH